MFKSDSSFNVLYTTDVEKTYTFFEKIDVEITEKSTDKVVVKFGSFELHYILAGTEPFDDYKYITEPTNYGQGVIFYIETTNIYEAQKLIISAGGTIKSKVFQNMWNCRELLFEDPNGYKFALYEC